MSSILALALHHHHHFHLALTVPIRLTVVPLRHWWTTEPQVLVICCIKLSNQPSNPSLWGLSICLSVYLSTYMILYIWCFESRPRNHRESAAWILHVAAAPMLQLAQIDMCCCLVQLEEVSKRNIYELEQLHIPYRRFCKSFRPSAFSRFLGNRDMCFWVSCVSMLENPMPYARIVSVMMFCLHKYLATRNIYYRIASKIARYCPWKGTGLLKATGKPESAALRSPIVSSTCPTLAKHLQNPSHGCG